MKRIYLLCMVMLSCLMLSAEEYKELWIVGSAVPGGAQKLEKVSDADFKYAGKLSVGELRVVTTKKIGKNTRFLTPVLPAGDNRCNECCLASGDNRKPLSLPCLHRPQAAIWRNLPAMG